MSQLDVALDPTSQGEAPAAALQLAPDAETAAATCLAIFLADALPPDTAAANSLAAILFAHGAANGLARSASLSPRAHARLERALLRSIAGAGWWGAAHWRRTLAELEGTAQGILLRRHGEESVRSWLRGESPARHWDTALAATSRGNA